MIPCIFFVSWRQLSMRHIYNSSFQLSRRVFHKKNYKQLFLPKLWRCYYTVTCYFIRLISRDYSDKKYNKINKIEIFSRTVCVLCRISHCTQLLPPEEKIRASEICPSPLTQFASWVVSDNLNIIAYTLQDLRQQHPLSKTKAMLFLRVSVSI